MSKLRLRDVLPIALAVLLSGLACPAFAAGQAPQGSNKSSYTSDFPKALREVQPPWSTPLYEGTEVTVPGLENVPDIHGEIIDPQLVVFFAGNQYMVVNKLLRAFIKANPQYPRVVAFTFPPGRLVRAMERGNGILLGNMHISLKPDVLTAGQGSMTAVEAKHHWFRQTEAYARNRLAIMVYRDNPEHVTGLAGLAAPKLRLCMPNPEWEGIARHAIIPALRATGGEALVDAVYKHKVEQGTTFLTHIHHRETPIRIMDHQCDAGVVWYTEAYFHGRILHHPVDMVDIPAADNKIVTYIAGSMKDAPHSGAAGAFMKFLVSPEGQAIYREFGFMKP